MRIESQAIWKNTKTMMDDGMALVITISGYTYYSDFKFSSVTSLLDSFLQPYKVNFSFLKRYP